MLSPINISKFTAGQWIKQRGFRSFIPIEVNRQWLIDVPEVEALTVQAHHELGRLDAFSELIPDVNFFIRMHIAKEATLSSKIEGTQTSMEEAFLKSENLRPEARDDWQEVQNYIMAMNKAIELLDDLPLSNRLLKETHRILLQGVGGQQKQPGTFRRSQNWIGGASLADAIFIPPPQQEVVNLMSDLEKFLHNEDVFIADLIKIAIAHYQFETIHPFLDGNGRVGRLLITLYLVSKKLLHRPSLYLSAFFEENRPLYYENLMRVRQQNDMVQWLKFFMVGVIQTSQSSVNTFRQISRLRQELEQEIIKLGKKHGNASALLRHLFSNPVITARETETLLQCSTPTAYALLRDFKKLGILEERQGYQKILTYKFSKYLALFE